MTRFNVYAKRANEIAKANFEKFTKAEKACKKAEKTYEGLRPDTTALERAKCRIALEDARETYTKAKRDFADSSREFDNIRKELITALDNAYSVDPAKLDNNTLELLKSGILSGREYIKLLKEAQAADNVTMVRLIGKYAGDAAKTRSEKYGNDSDTASMRIAEHESRSFTGGDRLEAYDTMTSIYNRCIKNPLMIDHWDELVSSTVENF